MTSTDDAPIRAKATAVFGELPAIGLWLQTASVITADILARSGADFAILDMEHGPAGYETALTQILAFEAQRRPVIIRPPLAGDPWIKRALDIGAAGILAPNVANAETAREVVKAAHYGPRGGRGVAARMVRASGYGADDSYQATWNERAIVIVQIETPAGLAEASAIAAVDGVDGLFFGPADFAAAAGHPGAAALVEAYETMAAAARAQGKLVGVLPFAGRDAAALRKSGVDIIPIASDVGLLRDAASAALDRARS